MPAREINLIPETKLYTPKEDKQRALYNKIAPIILGGYVVILVAFVGISLYISINLAVLESSISQETETIRTLSKDEGTYMILKNKAIALEQIVGRRYPYTELYTLIKQLSGDKVTLNSVDLSENGTLKLNVTLPDSSVLDEFIAAMLNETTSQFSQIQLSSVSIKEDRTYLVSFDVKTQKKSI